MAKTKDKVAGRVRDARPYVERAVRDEQFRSDLRSAYNAAREVYDELIGRRSVTGAARRAATDRDIQDTLRQAIEDLRAASNRLQKSGSHKGRNTSLLLAGITLGILFNPFSGAETRRWLREKFLGGGDEFGYGGDNNQ
jgi:hypothetical protein